MHILGTIIIGFIAGVVAKLITPEGLGQALGWYGPDQNAGFVGATVGAVLILLVWGLIQKGRTA